MPAPYSLPNNSYHDAHFWVDWVELTCVGNIDGTVDRAGIAKRVRAHKKDLGEAPAADGDGDGGGAVEPAAESDVWNDRAEKWFKYLRMRAGRFKDAYPFTLSADGNSLSLHPDLTPLQQLYLALLMASCLRCFPDSASDLAASFELVSLEGMRRLLPAEAQVHLFGASKLKGKKYEEGKFKDKLWSNLKGLVEAWRETLLLKEKDFAPGDKGDNGLDLVGWYDFGGDTPGIFAMFGQCACTKEWDKKQFTSSANRWSSAMTLTTHPLNSVFVPLCVRDENADWSCKADMARDTLLVDRSRLIYLVRPTVAGLTGLPAFAAVTSMIDDKEPLF